MSWYTDLSYDQNVEGKPELGGDFVSNGHTTARNSEDETVRSVCILTEL
jgi:hypothetical protein